MQLLSTYVRVRPGMSRVEVNFVRGGSAGAAAGEESETVAASGLEGLIGIENAKRTRVLNPCKLKGSHWKQMGHI